MRDLYRLATKNIAGSSFRSAVVLLCALVVTGLAVSTLLIVRGAQQSLQLAMDRLGADIIVVPEGAATKVESALLMGEPTQVWMPESVLAGLAAIQGVEKATPQLYLSSLKNASCCAVSDMFMVAYDPATDFTVEPWLESRLGGGLGLGEAVGGTHVFVPEGEQNIKLYGYFVTLRGNMEPTGTNLDQTIFFTFDTARDMARLSRTQAEEPLEIPDGTVSSVLIKVAPGVKTADVAVEILKKVPGVTPIESLNLFQAFRIQITGLLKAMVAVLTITTILSLVLIALIFSMAANERRREIGVLRALGATRDFVLKTLLTEAALLALAGAIPGILLACFCVYLFRDLIIRSIGVPFLLPNLSGLLMLLAGGMLVALIGVTLAALIPALHISRQDPAVAMRE